MNQLHSESQPSFNFQIQKILVLCLINTSLVSETQNILLIGHRMLKFSMMIALLMTSNSKNHINPNTKLNEAFPSCLTSSEERQAAH